MSTRRTLAVSIVRKVTHNVAAVAALLAVALFAMTEAPYDPATRPSAEGSPAAAMEKCQPVNGGEMTGAVVTKDGEARLVRGRVFRQAVAQEFYGEAHGLRVAAFCR